jgi:hypothetical protein
MRDLPPTVLLGIFSNIQELIGFENSLLHVSREETYGTAFISSATLGLLASFC